MAQEDSLWTIMVRELEVVGTRGDGGIVEGAEF